MRCVVLLLLLAGSMTAAEPRPRAREAGVAPGILPTGALNAITDVAGVRIGQTTLIRGEHVRTGVTVILPHGGNLFREKVPAAVFVGNGFGKLMGFTQIAELGELESPIALTSTLNVPRVADALIDWMLALPGNEDVRSINVVVGETNDGQLNDIRGRHVGREEVFAALRSAKGGPVEEGSVGAGTGTVAFGWKGGIGTSSRKLPAKLGGWTVGVLVQSNYGGILTIDGAPVGRALKQHYLRNELQRPDETANGSIMIVIATDAPVDARNLERMGARAMMGLARTGAAGTNGSGDYAIAFSTNRNGAVKNDDMSPIFLAAIEATEEAIYNSLFKATAVGGKIQALPLEDVLSVVGSQLSVPQRQKSQTTDN
ncbi:MAG TPA: P1 family peptidase [Thermoanaerobaculia bacterium]|nr:P1 family peptidase [Thermoanaerobaculia bacterium]